LINQGVHTVDLLLWLLGDVARVQGRTATLLHKIEAEDTATAILEFASGALGILHATTAAYPGYPRRVEITGTEGTVILEHDRIVAANLRNSQSAAIESAPLDENLSSSTATVSDFRGHQSVLEDFLQAIQQNRAPACDGIEGRRSLALIETIYRAAKTPDRTATV
jgi:predicted dehydrogenase